MRAPYHGPTRYIPEVPQEYAVGALYDPTTGAPFGHVPQLPLAENAHFDPAKRGLALATAGCLAGSEASGVSALLVATHRRAIPQEFKAPLLRVTETLTLRKVLCQDVGHVFEAFRSSYAAESPQFKKKVGTFLG